MARPPRLELANSWYYVSNASASRQPLFRSSDDRRFFCSLMAECVLRHGAQWHAFCLLDHSYHLLVFTREANLNRIMRHINGVFAQHYQRQYRKKGPLFSQRYKSLVIDGDQLGVPLSVHLHRLTHSAGGVFASDDFEGSSLRFYLGLDKAPEWLFLLGEGGKQRAKRTGYRQAMQQVVTESLDAFIDRHRDGVILGDEAFVRTIRKQSRGRPSRSNSPARPHARTILRDTARFYDLRQRDLMISTRGRGVESPARSVAMYLCQVTGGLTLNEVAELFSLAGYASAGSTIRNVRKRMAEDPAFYAQVKTLEQQLLALSPAP